MKTSKNDGGYFAIKGFAFQFDKTILEILTKNDPEEEIQFEINEDLENKNCLFQIKYKETATYVPSAIKKPICKLLEQYKTIQKETVLYAYFSDKSDTQQKLSIDELNIIIEDGKVGKKQYTFEHKLKENFVANFTLQFSESFVNQFNEVIEAIKKTFSCTDDVALINYPIIYKFLEQKVTSNPKKSKQKRICTKNELIALITTKRKVVFFDAYVTFLGQTRYLKLIKNEYFFESNANGHERFFIIELAQIISVTDLKNIVLALKERFYIAYPRRKMVTSPAPYIYFHSVKPNILKSLKHELLNDGYSFRDGHPFKNANFHAQTLIEECTTHNNICVKFINNKNDIIEVINKLNKTRKIYQFYITKPLKINVSYENIYIKIENPKDIIRIFN